MQVWQAVCVFGGIVAIGGLMVIIFAPAPNDSRADCALDSSCDLYKWDHSNEYRDYYGKQASTNVARLVGGVMCVAGLIIVGGCWRGNDERNDY